MRVRSDVQGSHFFLALYTDISLGKKSHLLRLFFGTKCEVAAEVGSCGIILLSFYFPDGNSDSDRHEIRSHTRIINRPIKFLTKRFPLHQF